MLTDVAGEGRAGETAPSHGLAVVLAATVAVDTLDRDEEEAERGDERVGGGEREEGGPADGPE